MLITVSCFKNWIITDSDDAWRHAVTRTNGDLSYVIIVI